MCNIDIAPMVPEFDRSDYYTLKVEYTVQFLSKHKLERLINPSRIALSRHNKNKLFRALRSALRRLFMQNKMEYVQ